MTQVADRIAKLRAVMAEKNIDAYVIPTADFHQSEYVGEYFKAREFMTGFTGSYGTAVITADDGGLWTDGRYFFQAENELAGSGIKLMKMFVGNTPSVTEYLADKLTAGNTVAFDGRVLSMGEGKEYEEFLAPQGINLKYDEDLVNQIWEDRPPLSQKPTFFLPEQYSGENTASKLQRIRGKMREAGASIHVVASLDDICWTLNVRGDDIDFFPLLLSYAIIDESSVQLYVDADKLDDDSKANLVQNNVTVHPYNDIYEDVKKFTSEDTVMIDPMKMNYALYKNIRAAIVEAQNPAILMKAMKNETELANIRAAHIKDGVAVTKLMYWVKNNYDKETITELSAIEKLTSLRAAQEGYINDSFEPLIAYADHAAMMHYSPSEETDVQVKAGQFLLTDTGGGYYQGSTDITRTFIIGSVSDEFKKYFTAVCRAMMRLSRARFLYGCYGYNLDVLARGPIWDLDLDYQCGTGHGVGYLGNVHEPPTGFRWYVVPSKNEHHQLEEGMVITDEPGIYEDGSFGIRTENEFIVRKGVENKYGQFMHFETITFAPIDLDGIDRDEMNEDERRWLNDYHAQVYTKIAPHLTDDEREWLKDYTRAI